MPPPLQLTPERLTAALEGLTWSERAELLQLLQQQELAASEAPIDNRPSIESFLHEIRDQHAATTSDSPGYIEAWNQHHDAMRRHCDRLGRGRPRSEQQLTFDELITLAHIELAEARAAAIAEGYPDPDELFRKPAPPPLEPDPIERLKRATLPRATQRDLADSQTRHGETATYEHIIAEQKRVASASEPEDKLRWFRD